MNKNEIFPKHKKIKGFQHEEIKSFQHEQKNEVFPTRTNDLFLTYKLRQDSDMNKR